MVQRYAWSLRLLHWLMAVLLIGMLALGLYMKALPFSPTKLQLYSWHKWIGITLMALVVLRLSVRFLSAKPRYPSHMGPTSKMMAHLGHWLLYVLMLCIPLSGWLMSSAKGFQTVWFGVLPLPDLIQKDLPLGEQLVVVHGWLNWLFIAVLAGHILAALKHQFMDRDAIFHRISLTPTKKD